MCISLFGLLLSGGESSQSILNVQSSNSVVSDSLWCHGLQHARLTCPSPTPRGCSNSCIDLVMPSNHHILCRLLLLLPSVFPNINVFSNDSFLLIRWPKCWSFSFSTSPPSENSGLSSFRIDQFVILLFLPVLSYVIGTDRFWGKLQFYWRCSILESNL